MSERRLRILLLIDDASVGGGQQHVLWLAEHIDRRWFDVAVACAPTGYLVDELARREIVHYPIRMANVPNPVTWAACRRILREFHPHVLHTHGGTAGVVGRLAAARTGIKRVHTHHGIHYLHDAIAWRRAAYEQVEAALLRWTDRIICVAQRDVETGLGRGILDRSKTVVVLNGIETNRFAHERSYAALADPVVGTVGRLHPQKGHRFLLEAVPAILKQFPAARFTVIGDGELRRELADRASAQGIAAHVELRGSRTDIPEQLRSMDVFVLPSLWEGLPIAVLEAMASGLPVVATRVDGVMEVLEDDVDAILVPSRDAPALSAAVARLIGEPALRRRLGESAREKVRRHFGIDRMVRETEAVYRSLFR